MSGALHYADTVTEAHRPPKYLVWLAVVGSILAGALTATQSFINGQLGRELQNGILAAWFSFVGGLIVILLVFAFARRSWRRVRILVRQVRTRTLPWWMLLGGLAGAAYVVTQGLTVGILGVALFTLGVVAGQISASIVFDRFGLAPGAKLEATWRRIVGGSLAVIAVAVAVSSQLSGVATHWLIVLPFAGGVIVAFQVGINGHVNLASGSGIVTASLNYLVGTIALTVAAAISVLAQGWPTVWPEQWWLYTGGPFGLVFIALASYFVRIVGVLVLGMSSIAGQLIASLALDALAPVTRNPITIGLVVGTALALVALIVASWREFRPARSANVQ